MSGTRSAPTREGGRDAERRARFGRLLAEALRARRMKQEHLAGFLGTTQSSVSGWINGKYEPAAETVFRMERSLALEPGHLSRPLGYLPVEAVSAPASVEGAILQSTLLEDEAKAALMAVYRVLVDRRTPGTKPERPLTPAGRTRSAPVRPRTVATTTR